MKSISKLFLLPFMVIIAANSNAQINRSSRPCLFASYSSTIPTSLAELDKAFSIQPGASVKFRFSNTFSFSGTVISSVKKYNNLSTVLVKSPSFNNALLCLSKRINDDNSITYVGRIINEKYADGYELAKDNAGNYSFTKIKTEDLIQDF